MHRPYRPVKQKTAGRIVRPADFFLAERAGFEPAMVLPICAFQTHAIGQLGDLSNCPGGILPRFERDLRGALRKFA